MANWDIQDLAMTVYRRFRQLARPLLAVVDNGKANSLIVRCGYSYSVFVYICNTIAIDDMEYYIQGT